MKLNKKKLLAFIRGAMSELGYVEFDDPSSDANLFVKEYGGLFLTIGFTISRLYEDSFTCNYYLSRTTSWSECWGDVPRKIYVRPGELMTPQERYDITIDPRCKNNPEYMSDMWWNAFDSNGKYDSLSLKSLTDAIILTEGRVSEQPNIIEKIYTSKVLEAIYNKVSRTIEIQQSESYGANLHFLPSREVRGVSMKWHMAAETALREFGDRKCLCPFGVKRLAADASRVYHMRQLAKK